MGDKLRQIGALRQNLRQARAASGRPIMRQLAEIARLRRYPNRLYWEEYFRFRLFDKSPQAMGEFLGWRIERAFDALLHDLRWRAVFDDKLLFDAYLRPKGIALAEIQAAILPDGRSLGSVPTAATVETGAALLRERVAYPCFTKAVAGMGGEAAEILTGYDPARDTVERKFAGSIGLEEFLRAALPGAPGGLLVQELLVPHPDFVPLSGSKLSGFRVVVAVHPDGPRVIRAFWKVVQGENVIDQVFGGRTGNLRAFLDPESGRVTSLTRGGGFEVEHFERVPETGARLVGQLVPHWPEIVETCLAAARALPMARLQFHDIALTPRGPVLMEINDRGDINGPQGGFLEGLYNARFRAFLAAWGHDLARPATQRLIARLQTVDDALDAVTMDRAGHADIYDTLGRGG